MELLESGKKLGVALPWGGHALFTEKALPLLELI